MSNDRFEAPSVALECVTPALLGSCCDVRRLADLRRDAPGDATGQGLSTLRVAKVGEVYVDLVHHLSKD